MPMATESLRGRRYHRERAEVVMGRAHTGAPRVSVGGTQLRAERR